MKTHSIIAALPVLNFEQLKALNISKGEAFDNLGHPYDAALPQDWLNDFADWCCNNPDRARGVDYDRIRSTTVWGYGDETSGPITCCREVAYAHRRWQGSFKVEHRHRGTYVDGSDRCCRGGVVQWLERCDCGAERTVCNCPQCKDQQTSVGDWSK